MEIKFLAGGGGGSGGGTPGGSDTQVQFNDGGVFGGDAGFTYDKGNDRLTIGASGSIQFLDSAVNIPLSNTNSGYPYINYNTTQTPDALTIGVGSLSNSLIIHQYDDAAFDFAHAQQTNPTLFIHSAAQSTTQWIGLTHDGTDSVISSGAGAVNLKGVSGAVKITNDSSDSISIALGNAASLAVSNVTGNLTFNSIGYTNFNYNFNQNGTTIAKFGATGSGTDGAGVDSLISGGRATGNAVSGSILFQTGDAGGSGTTLQTLSTKALLNQAGKLIIGTSDATTFGAFQWNTTQTVDTNMLLTGSTSNHWVFAESADSGFDFAHAQTTNPTLFIHSAAQSTTQWISLAHDGATGIINSGTNQLSLKQTGTEYIRLDAGTIAMDAAGGNGLKLTQNSIIIWADSGTINSGSNTLYLLQDSAATLQLGADANAAPIAQTIKAHDGITGTDVAGASMSIAGGRGTGAGAPGDSKVKTAVQLGTGTTAQTLGDRVAVLGKYVTLTAGAATSFATIGIPTSSVAGGEVLVTVEANDGADFQARTVRAIWAAVNQAGVTSATIATAETTVSTSTTSTLTATLAVVDNGANAFNFTIDAASSLTETTLRAVSQITKNFGTGAIIC